MPLIRSLVQLAYFTGAPEDVATNTLYYQSADGTSLDATYTAANARLQSFYTALGPYLSKVVQGPITVRHYDMSAPKPRVPIGFGALNFTPTAPALNMPEECAAVLSFQGERVSGADMARRRGRIFMGPLSASAYSQPSTAGYVQFTSAFRNAMANAAAAMANTTVNVATWVVYSETDNLAHPISNGWIDVQPDVQRRRGHKVAGRTLWQAP